ncbi:phosphopantetheine-binding protein, partial [Bacillus subtilis]|uniref:acyl carrier protein n=2 Tax=Bacillus subtilis TaxID=1423 RepID=UPI002DBAA264
VESYPKEEVQATKKTSLPYYLLALSAKTEEALTEKRTDLIAFLESPEGQEADLSQISYTLLQGRQHFRHRWAMVVQGREDALFALKQAINKEDAPNLLQGQVPASFTGQSAIKKYIANLLQESHAVRKEPQQYQENLMALASMYCQGYEMDWAALFAGTDPQCLHMPTYPFARNTYWVVENEQEMPLSIRKKMDFLSEETMHPVRKQTEEIEQEGFRQHVLQHLTTPDPYTWSSEPIAKPEAIQLTGLAKDKTKEEKRNSNKRDVENIEETLVTILKEVLDLDNVDRKMPFIEMGMDSIVGVEWIQAVNERYQTSLTVNSIYEYPNIHKFAKIFAQEDISDAKNDPKIDLAPAVEPTPKQDDPPVTNTIEAIQSFLVASLAESLSMDQKDIELDGELVELGLDSIIGVEWIQTINERYRVELTANTIYEYPYLREFAAFMHGQLAGQMEDKTADSASLQLQKLIHSVQAGEIDIEQADQLLQRGDIRK